jgi:hypothetical protein
MAGYCGAVEVIPDTFDDFFGAAEASPLQSTRKSAFRRLLGTAATTPLTV